MKHFDLQKEILRHVQKESDEEWGKNTEIPPFPVYKSCEGIKNNVGWRNFLRQLRP